MIAPPHRDHRGRRGHQQVGDHRGKGTVDHQQHEEDHHRNRLRPREPISRPLSMPTDWPRLRALAQSAPEVMHTSEEDGAEDHQCEGRTPAPDHRDGRADDGRGAGHRGEVVAPEHEFVGRYVVHAVAHGVRGRPIVGIEPVDSFGDELGVEDVAQRHGAQADQQQRDCTHLGIPRRAARRRQRSPVWPSWGDCYDRASTPRTQGTDQRSPRTFRPRASRRAGKPSGNLLIQGFRRRLWTAANSWPRLVTKIGLPWRM